MIDDITELTAHCCDLAWHWKLEYHEIESCYYAEAWSPCANSEFVEVKRAAYAGDAIRRLIRRINDWRDLHD